MTAKSCLSSLIAFCKVTGSVDEGDQYIFFTVDFGNAFDPVSCNNHVDNLLKFRSDKWMVRCTENWLNCQA